MVGYPSLIIELPDPALPVQLELACVQLTMDLRHMLENGVLLVGVRSALLNSLMELIPRSHPLSSGGRCLSAEVSLILAEGGGMECEQDRG